MRRLLNGLRLGPAVMGGFLIAIHGTAAACSGSYGFMPWRLSGETPFTLFTAQPLMEFVQAGPGSVMHPQKRSNIESTAKTDRATDIFGEYAELDELERSAPDVLQAYVRKGSSRIVLVRWSYGAGCEPLALTGASASWPAQNSPYLFAGSLRERRHWAGDIPTFDVYDTPSATNPYHPSFAPRFDDRRPVDPEVGWRDFASASEMLTVVEMLPVVSDFRERSAAMREARPRIQTWIEANWADFMKIPVTRTLLPYLNATQRAEITALLDHLDHTLLDFEWSKAQPSGCRVWDYARLEIYYEATWSGGCVRGTASGSGVLTLGKTRYEGLMKNGVRDGAGVESHGTGNRRVGHWRSGMMHGDGVEVEEDGTRYEGEWRYDTYHGKGTMRYPDGSRYVGRWFAGQKYGPGEFISTDGAVESQVHGFSRGTPLSNEDVEAIFDEHSD